MRIKSRILLVVLALSLIVPAIYADGFVSDCPLDFVGSAPSSSAFELSPHGLFMNGEVIYSLRGQHLLTMNISDLGDVEVLRDDVISTLAPRDTQGGVAYQNGFMFVSGEGGLEIYDLRNTVGGPSGAAPILVSRTPGLYYRRLAINGNLLAGVYPISDFPCLPDSDITCRNQVDVFSVANMSAPALMTSILSKNTSELGFNDIAWTNGFLYITGPQATEAFDLTNPSHPIFRLVIPIGGHFLTTNGTDLLGIGEETLIGVFIVGPGPQLRQFATYSLPVIIDRANPLMFHQQAFINDSRLITMVDEKDPETNQPARTIAFDVFDFGEPMYQGSDQRIFENVSMTQDPDEVKFDPLVVGDFVYVVGEQSGTQVWGACGVATGAIEFDNLVGLTCGGSTIHGWVTGPERIIQVEVFLDDVSLGVATLGNPRTDIDSPTPAFGWQLPVDLDQVSQGNRVLRVVATDVLGNTAQVASKTIFFNGPGENCTTRRRATSHN